jgi:hypothetical protein
VAGTEPLLYTNKVLNVAKFAPRESFAITKLSNI